MAEEEREDLLDFRHHADLQTRHDIAVQFLAYEAKPLGRHPDPGQGPRDLHPGEQLTCPTAHG